MRQFFPRGAAPVRLGGRRWHSRHILDNYTGLRRDYLDRSLVGYIWVYNLLDEGLIEAETVK